MPFAAGGLLHIPVAVLQAPTTWHSSSTVHPIGVPAQTPARQLSPCVQALPSLQAVPFAAGGLLHIPVVGSQTPATWHGSRGLQVTLPPAMQVPDWHVAVQPAPHGVPLGLFGFEHAPVAGMHRASWQASAPPHATGFVPMHTPA